LAFGRQAGVYLNDSCLVVLTRTIGVSALDGLLLGWESWLGHSFLAVLFDFFDDSRKHCKLEPKSGDLHDLQHQGLLHLVWARVCPAL
jgi:hypothetical protein